MARILLSAYACDPQRGSEHAVGWNWAIELARSGHEVCVVTRARNQAAIVVDRESKLPNLTFVYYELPAWIERCRRFTGDVFYYLAWQWLAARSVRRNVVNGSFDCAQHVTFASVRYPSFFAFLGVPFYFGPVSGGESVPRRLRSDFSMQQRWREFSRDLSNAFLRYDPVMRMVFRRADKIIVTPDTEHLIPVEFRPKCIIRLAIGVSSLSRSASASAPLSRIPRLSAPPNLLFVGRLLEWKGLAIALRCVSQLKQEFPEVCLTLAGDGPARPRLLQLAKALNIESHLRWAGWLSREQLQDEYRRAQLLLFPSLRDSGGLAVVEALSNGLPVICTDRGGPGLLVTSQCGCVIPTEDKSSTQIVCELASAAGTLLSNPELRERKSVGARKRARHFQFRDLVASIYPAATPEGLRRLALR